MAKIKVESKEPETPAVIKDRVGQIISRLTYSYPVSIQGCTVTVPPHGRVIGVRESDLGKLPKGIIFKV